MKYVVVTGGVLSGLGKGIATSSIGKLLSSRGIRVTAIKIDPYVNVDAGTMNPFEHGEVFVLDDGGEVDQDLGNYERFLGEPLTRDHNITTGKVFKAVIDRERRGDYLGRTVQIIPHVTQEIKENIRRVAERSKAEVALVEVGGTVGDIESAPFLEAVRELVLEEGRRSVAVVHTTLVPVLGVVGEQKTKPTQHSVMELRRAGLDPDLLVCRSERPLEEKTKRKISLFCNVPVEAVISAPDARTIYEVPLLFQEQGVADLLVDRLGLRTRSRDLGGWREFVERVLSPRGGEVTVAIVGKYTGLSDSYVSIREAFVHAGASLDVRVNLRWIDSEELERVPDPSPLLSDVEGILVPGGFGSRGVEGKIRAIRFARETKTPFLGICFGFQLAVVEWARWALGLAEAHSTEIHPSTNAPVIDLLPGHRSDESKGGTMRLGASEVHLREGTRAHSIYGTSVIRERHRHRYEVNPSYVEKLEGSGLVFSGKDPSGHLQEVLELPNHPYFLGTQFHPEFLSRPDRPAPLFCGLVEAAREHKRQRREERA